MKVVQVLFMTLMFSLVAIVQTASAEQRAQVCFKAYDTHKSERYSAEAELATQATGGAFVGCEIKRVAAKFFCIPANVGAVATDAPLGSIEGQDLLHEQACYKVKCPADVLTAHGHSHRDLFKEHGINVKSKPFMVCFQGQYIVNVRPPAP